MLTQFIDTWLLKRTKQLCEQKSLTVRQLETYLILRFFIYRVHLHFFRDFKYRTSARYIIEFPLAQDFKKDPIADTDIIHEEELAAILALADKRIVQRIPFEYITHEAEYLDRTFYVDDRVLIPRSLMNTRFSEFLDDVSWTTHRVLDLCTGSGCIGITLALMNPELKVDLVDLSEDALQVAQKNVSRFHLEDRVKCICSDLFSNVEEKYDLIISNPPYVSASDCDRVPHEFRHEPRMALEADHQGLAIIDRILAESPQHLNMHGTLIVETGIPTAKLVKKKYKNLKLEWFKYKTQKGKVLHASDPGVFRILKKNLMNGQ